MVAFQNPGPIDLQGTDLVNMIVQSLSAFACILETKGVMSMSEVATCLKDVESDDPAVRWLFDRLAFELQDPETPILRLIAGGKKDVLEA